MQQERGKRSVQIGMSRFDNTTPEPAVRRDLHICARCRAPFVVPVSILDVHDDGRYVVELGCSNCEAASLAVHDEASLEALDHELDRSLLAMQEALDTLVLADELERIDRFAEALQADLILPEDF
jgi:hypothetical protein